MNEAEREDIEDAKAIAAVHNDPTEEYRDAEQVFAELGL